MEILNKVQQDLHKLREEILKTLEEIEDDKSSEANINGV